MSRTKIVTSAVLVSAIIASMLTVTAMIPQTEAALNTQYTISSGGTIIPHTNTLTAYSSVNPSKTGVPILISGKITNEPLSLSVVIEYSQDKTAWKQISTVTPNSDGSFETQFVFPTSGKYSVRAIHNAQTSLFTQIVADRFVNLNGEEDATSIQAAIDSLPITGGTVYIRSGVYDLNGQSLIVRSNLNLLGDGVDRTIVRLYPTKHSDQASCFNAIMSEEHISDFTVENFTLTQNFEALNNHGSLVLSGASNKNIIIKNMKITDSTSSAISVFNYDNVLIENCKIDRTWTGIVVLQGSNAIIRGNSVTNTVGDGIYPEFQSNNVTIENNYLKSIGDTAIDIECKAPLTHKNTIIRNNIIEDGSLRVTNAINVQVIGNTIHGRVSIDGGQGPPINVTVIENHVISNLEGGIEFLGAYNSSAINNIVEMQQPIYNTTQAGIMAAFWENGLILKNTILNADSYGINFGGWQLGGSSQITIQENIIRDYGTYGIYDDNKPQSFVSLQGNVISSQKETAEDQVFTQCPSNNWTFLP
ncbi:MAG: right-handed parallel beta-helix repeat-containing protein [Candidatus Bathyarchaeota archaeon]|nr:right-handed parallel beta-helix repeat-containing protein [Candidatus Bathyarchaeota archaeon]